MNLPAASCGVSSIPPCGRGVPPPVHNEPYCGRPQGVPPRFIVKILTARMFSERTCRHANSAYRSPANVEIRFFHVCTAKLRVKNILPLAVWLKILPPYRARGAGFHTFHTAAAACKNRFFPVYRKGHIGQNSGKAHPRTVLWGNKQRAFAYPAQPSPACTAAVLCWKAPLYSPISFTLCDAGIGRARYPIRSSIAVTHNASPSKKAFTAR